jgi:hypothetical protein
MAGAYRCSAAKAGDRRPLAGASAALRPTVQHMRKRAARQLTAHQEAHQDWHDAELKAIDPELLALTHGYVEAELNGRESLGNRLGGLITLAGALLALLVAAAREAAGAHLDGTARTIFSITFIGAVLCLVAVLLIALHSMGPDVRATPSADLLRHYGEHGTTTDEAREDAYKLSVTVLAQLDPTNRSRAEGVKRARLALILALLLAAAAAGTVYFGTPWSTNQPHPTSHSPLRHR